MGRRFAVIGALLLSAGVSLGQQSDQGKPRTDLYGDPLPPGAILRMGSTRLKHSQAAVAFSKDGKLLISAGDSGDVRFWDVATGKEVRRMPLE
jgi:WD40 repeat protein